MSTVTQSFIEMMEGRVEALKAKSDWSGAQTTAATTVDSAREQYDADPTTVGVYAKAVEIQANVYRDYGDKETAQTLYSAIVDLLEDTFDYRALCGRVGANLALFYEEQELLEDAVNFYSWALENFENANPPEWGEAAGVLNNMAFLYENDGNIPQAEALFMKALQINNDNFGPNHEATADVWNNLGGLHYKAGKYAQSLEMHKLALDIRIETLGERHTETAQSWGNLALAYTALEDLDNAKNCFQSALTILESSSSANANDYATINSNYATVLRQYGRDKDAEQVEKRMNKFLKKH